MSGLWSLARMNNTKLLRVCTRTRLLRDFTHSDGRGILGVPGEAVAGPSGAAHPSDSCGVGFCEIAADLESQLDIISEVPEGCIRFLPDG